MRKNYLPGILILAVFSLGLSSGPDESNRITDLWSNSDSFKEVEPLDFSNIVSAGAFQNKDGTRLQVCLSNAEFDITQMSSDLIVPITDKSQFIAVIKFNNAREEIVPGIYSPTAGYGKPFWAFAEVKLHKGEKGVVLSLGVNEGTAVITEKTADRVKGTFDMRAVTKTGKNSEIAGTFDVTLTTSRW